ncbi:MAG: hypothetical protein P8P74_04270 [Crocinitomicaceae bacterium]|nr:hypothetical protein [Crocinitomicaceae bacterium]
MSDSTKTPAIIVIRHGEDMPDDANGHAENTPCDNTYSFPGFPGSGGKPDFKNNVVPAGQIRLYRLSLSNAEKHKPNKPYGEAQAAALAKAMPDWLLNTMNIAPITHMIVKRPYGQSDTTNPFQTSWQFADWIQKNQKDLRPNGADITFDLPTQPTEDGGKVKRLPFNVADLMKNPNSTFICWDRQGLWAKSSEDKGDFILKSLCREEDHGKLISPVKGQTIYVFTNPNSDGKYALDKLHNLSLDNGGSIS